MTKAHVSQKKKDEVKTLKELISKYKVIGIIDLTNLPSFQFQKIKQQLKDSLLIRVTKRRLIKLALEDLKEQKKDIEKLEKFLDKSMPALLFTNDDPFKLGKLLKKSKTFAMAKAGQIAPNDLIINAGPTPFAPGPIIGELGSVGLKTAIEGGKIAIKEDKILAKRGEEITQKVAGVLAKLNIKPMEIGLNLVGVYDDGNLIDGDILAIDEKEYLKNLQSAYQGSFNLAVFINYATKETIKNLIAKAENSAKYIGDKINIKDIKTEEVKEEPKVEEKPKEEIKTEEIPKEESKVEEKKEEPKVEETPKGEPTQQAVFSKEAEKVAEDLITGMKDAEIKKKTEENKEDKKPKDDVPSAHDLK